MSREAALAGARDIIAASHGRVRMAENAKVLPLGLLSPAAMELPL